MTLFGIIWIGLNLLCFFLPLRYLAALLVLSTVLQAAAVINISDKGIPPFFFTELFFLGRCALINNEKPIVKLSKWLIWGVMLSIISLLCSVLLPIIFAGVKVYPPNAGIDDSALNGGSPLVFTAGNVVQWVFLIVNLFTLYFFSIRKIDRKFITNTFLFTMLFVAIVGYWEYIAKTLYIIPFPTDFFYSNKGYAQNYDEVAFGDLKRLNSTFAEASFAAAFLASAFWAFMAYGTKKCYFFAFLTLIATVCTASTTAALTFVTGALLYSLFTSLRTTIYILLSLVVLVYIAYLTGLFDLLQIILFDKFDSQSGQSRTESVWFSVNLILQTFGLGVGLGSHRTTSIVFNVLCGIGVVGFLIFANFYRLLLLPVFKKRKEDPYAFSILLFALAMLAAQLTAVPDISFPGMWMWMFLAAHYAANFSSNNETGEAVIMN